jgi:hypothetical protein
VALALERTDRPAWTGSTVQTLDFRPARADSRGPLSNDLRRGYRGSRTPEPLAGLSAPDLPPLNGTASRGRIWGGTSTASLSTTRDESHSGRMAGHPTGGRRMG